MKRIQIIMKRWGIVWVIFLLVLWGRTAWGRITARICCMGLNPNAAEAYHCPFSMDSMPALTISVI